MILWMLWAVLVSALLGLAAAATERVLRAKAHPGRLAWAGAMVGSLAIQAWSLVHPAASVGPVAGAAPAGGVPMGLSLALLDRIAATLAPAPTLLQKTDPFLVGAWCLASALLAAALLAGLLRLRRRARRWPTARIGTTEVLVSEDFGPAVLGLRAPRVVFPRWALALDRARLEMAYAHEDEHRAAGDGWLLLAGVMAVTLTPWNPALWWHLRRLRASAEIDCDARVLRRGVAPSAYGTLLLEVGRRSAGHPLAVAALSKSPTLLERRLKMILNGSRPAGRWATAVALVAGMLLAAVACGTPAPTGVRGAPGTADVSAAGSTSPAVSLRLPPVATLTTQGNGTVDFRSGAPSKLRRSTMVIRGGALTLPDSVRPLVLVDGKRVELSSLGHLDPGSIRSISVLKGEMATKRFGARGAHGVILITTKAGGGK